MSSEKNLMSMGGWGVGRPAARSPDLAQIKLCCPSSGGANSGDKCRPHSLTRGRRVCWRHPSDRGQGRQLGVNSAALSLCQHRAWASLPKENGAPGSGMALAAVCSPGNEHVDLWEYCNSDGCRLMRASPTCKSDCFSGR